MRKKAKESIFQLLPRNARFYLTANLNHLIIIGKYFLYINSLGDKRYLFADFVTLVQGKVEIEKYIAVMRNKHTAFDKNGLIS